MAENVIEISEKWIQKIPNYSKKKATKAIEIIKLISTNTNILIDEMSTEINVTDKTIARYISELKDEKLLERVGLDNGGF